MTPQGRATWLVFFLTCAAAMSVAYYYVVIEHVSAWLAVLVLFSMTYLIFRVFRFP